MFYQIFLSPQVKQWAIVTYKHGVCVCVCVCVFTSIHLEGFICPGLVVQGTDQRCCVEDAFPLYQVPSPIPQYESPNPSNEPLYPARTPEAGKATT